ncbi:hypothetical protein STANM309S_03639 [Streptomyces tanashiensis]
MAPGPDGVAVDQERAPLEDLDELARVLRPDGVEGLGQVPAVYGSSATPAAALAAAQ